MQNANTLPDSQQWLLAVFEKAALGIALVDMRGRPVQVNPALERMSGYSAAELRSITLERVTHPDDLPRDRELLRELLRGQRLEYRVENRYLHRDGRIVWGHLTVSLVRGPDGLATHALALIEDITPRKEAESALEAREVKFRALIEHASDLVTVLDAEGTILYDSPSAERILGYRPEDRVGEVLLDLVHPDDRENIVSTLRALVAAPGSSVSYALRYRHSDGSYRWLDGIGTNLLHDPAVGGIVANSRDVTERKQAEQALERERALFERLFDSSPEGVALVDSDDRVLRINREFTRLFGFSEEESAGRPIRELLLPGDAEEDCLTITRRIAAGERVQMETVRLRKDGSPVDVSVQGARIPLGGGRVAVYGIYQDISERKRGERALRESEEKFRTTVDVLGEGVMITDLDERILYTNRRNCEITGYSREELLGQVASELLLPPEERERMRETHRRRAEGISSRYQMRQLRKDGSLVWVEVSGTPLHDATGEVVGTVGAIADITERKEMEHALRRMSTTDVLTGLLNRRGFRELAEREWALARRRKHDILVLFADLDGFKEINDAHGHAEGDRLLQEVGELLRGAFRCTDVIARLGGDEFVVLAVDAADETECSLAERLRGAVLRFNEVHQRPYQLSLSIGTQRALPGPTVTLDAVLEEADRRMYLRKRERKGTLAAR